ncbi:uncharacterized protein [Elaeis guineensis]|uniref:uncharacterized protein isoform X2 n=1 Tax=Elaeis guineensis var. tenera TaxID=51953 RepID=UPI003C6D9B54
MVERATLPDRDRRWQTSSLPGPSPIAVLPPRSPSLSRSLMPSPPVEPATLPVRARHRRRPPSATAGILPPRVVAAPPSPSPRRHHRRRRCTTAGNNLSGIMIGPEYGRSRDRQQVLLDDTYSHFSILHDELENLDETQLPESTEQTSAQLEPAQSEIMALHHHLLTNK